jgi:hypothetical protein
MDKNNANYKNNDSKNDGSAANQFLDRIDGDVHLHSPQLAQRNRR